MSEPSISINPIQESTSGIPTEGRKTVLTFAQHFNENLCCVIDCETTGLDATLHDMWQLCILPLTSEFKPHPKFLPFEIIMKLRRPENYDRENKYLNHKMITKAQIEGIDSDRAVDMFGTWYGKLGLKERKKILPLGQNYPFDRSFLINWMGINSYEFFFDYHFRDTCVVANYMNDRADVMNQPYPHPHISLDRLCQQLDVKNHKAHDALYDCLATAEVYRRLVLKGCV